MSKSLHIVASCAQTKSVRVPAQLHLGSVAHAAPEKRVREWVRHRDGVVAETVAASALYSGTYWATVRRLLERASASGYGAKLWVASAGYGLIAGSRGVKPYSATFAKGSKDSVCPEPLSRAERVDILRRWWNGITGRHGLASIVAKDKQASVLVVAGPAYIEAMQDDLENCAASMGRPERLVMVTSETSAAPADLAGNVIPSEARFVHKVGGALPTLHARVAEHVLEESRGRPLDARSLRAYAEALLASQPAWTVPERERGTDQEVLLFIRSQLRLHPGLSYTAALRQYRGQGRACEQKRFKNLFKSVIGVTHAA